MKTLTLVTMRWPEYDEPICLGTNKRKISTEALRLLRKEHGTGPVLRPAAMCSAPIRHDDLRYWKLPVVS